MTEKIKVNFLSDAPLGKGNNSLFDFYHKSVAPAFKEILENESCVHTIGLFSKWGTGKSTIIEMIKSEIKNKVFVFDAWKYQEDSLRRIFLIELLEFLIKNDLLAQDRKRLLDPLYKSIEEQKDVEADTETKKEKKWKRRLKNFLRNNWVIILLVSVFFIVSRVLVNLEENPDVINISKNISDLAISYGLLFWLLTPIFKTVLEEASKNLFQSLKPFAVVKTRVEKQESLNSPEEFERLFKLILEEVNQKVIIVFDNIDRVQGDTAIRILSTIKTFLDPSGIEKPIFIVPCDSLSITNQLEIFYGGSDDKSFDASEYLRKLFNVIIWTPEFIQADFHSYIKKLIQDSGEAKKYLDNEDVIYVINSAFPNNPREIKQFINNLLAALIVASKTEVWKTLKDNIPYLVKVMILRHKYESAFHRLKERWYEPENIWMKTDGEGLKNFLLSTSRITVKNAQPFIYFKEPIINKRLKNAEQLIISLAEGDVEEVKKVVKNESNKDDLFDFIVHLVNEYRNQKPVLSNIFKIHLEIFNELKLVTKNRNYYRALAKTLEEDLWQYFSSLPTTLIFNNLILEKDLEDQVREKIIKRYVLALGMDELKKPNNRITTEIILNLKRSEKYLREDNLSQFSKMIDEHYSTQTEVISLFETIEEQNKFLTVQALEKFLNSLSVNIFLGNKTLLFQFKDFILTNKKFDLLVQKVTDFLKKETGEFPDFRSEKEMLLNACNDFFNQFQKGFEFVSEQTKTQLYNELNKIFNNIRTWNDRSIVINSLYWIHSYLLDNQKREINNNIKNYFQNALGTRIVTVLDYWNKETMEKMIDSNLPTFINRSLSDVPFFDLIYKRVGLDKKVNLLESLIVNRKLESINYLKTLGDKIPGRQKLVGVLLQSASSSSLDDKEKIYGFLIDKIELNDSAELKNMVVSQIKSLLMSDVQRSQEIGYKLFSGANFLGEERKRDICREVLDWMRQSGRRLSSAHIFVLKAVSENINILQEILVKEFVYIVFNILKTNRDIASVEAALNILREAKPKYDEFEGDFKDLLARMKDWQKSETRNLVFEKFKAFRSGTSKEETLFWKDWETLEPAKL